MNAPVTIDPSTAAFLLRVRHQTLCRWHNSGLLVSRLTKDGEKYRLSEVLDFVKPLSNDAEGEVPSC